jgi:hypothetical protein
MEPVSKFFERYLAVWDSPEKTAAFYNEPFLAARGGTVRLCQTKKDAVAFFEDVDQKYRAKGMAAGELLAIDARELGGNAAAAIIHWAYQDRGGNTLWESTFTYNLYAVGGAWKIVLQTMHDE